MRVLVVGSSSFLGSRVASYIHKLQKYKIKAVEVLENLPMDTMAWYRWKKLQEEKVNPEFVASNNLASVISREDIDSIIFVPSLIFDGYSADNKTQFRLDLVIRSLHNFVSILEEVSSKYIQIVLLSMSEDAFKFKSIQKSWLRTFELSLSAYQNLHEQKVRLIKMKDVYGPWQAYGDNSINIEDGESGCVFIEDLESTVINVLEDQGTQGCIDMDIGEQCTGNDQLKATRTTEWIHEQRKSLNDQKDVMFSSYVVDSKNPIYGYTTKSNSAIYMKMWLLSAVKYHLSLAVCHDEFNTNFENRVRQFYPSIDFVKVENIYKGRSPNDYRFYVFYKYLLEHPEIKRAFLTDMRDVRFFADPFERMDVLGNEYLYIGTSVPFYLYPKEHTWVNSIIKACHASDAKTDVVKLHPHLNAGVLGGTRSMLLSFLTQLTRYFDKAPHTRNCNMGTIALVAHKYFNEYIFTGYPIQNAFKIPVAASPGLAIKHKNTD